MTHYIQVITTVAQKDEAERIAHLLVERRLAACVQVIGPISSHYRWQGQIESSLEFMCQAKTRRELFSRVEATIRQAHSYELPEIIAMVIEDGGADYLAWIDAQLDLGEEQ